MAGEDIKAGKNSAAKADTSNELATDRTDFALTRTLMAASRTLMSWIRTGISLISFGFTMYKFLQYMAEESKGVVAMTRSPQVLGIVMVGLGTLCLVFGLIEYISVNLQIGKVYKRHLWSSSFLIGLILVCFGVYMLVTVILNVNPF
jgi:putative membrane protein